MISSAADGKHAMQRSLIRHHDLGPGPFDVHETGLAEDLQVVGHGRLADVHGGDDLTGGHRSRLGGQQVQDEDPGRVTECFEPAGPRGRFLAGHGLSSGHRRTLPSMIDDSR